MIDRTIERVWDKKRRFIKFTHRGQHACACVEDSLFSSEKLPHWYMERRRCLQIWKEKKSFSSYRINFMQPKLYGKLLNHSSERGVVKFKNGNCTDCWLIRSLDVQRGIKACDGRILLPKTRLHGHYWSISIYYNISMNIWNFSYEDLHQISLAFGKIVSLTKSLDLFAWFCKLVDQLLWGLVEITVS